MLSEVRWKEDLGFRTWDLGCRVWDLGFGIWDLGFGIWGVGCRFQGLEMLSDARFKARCAVDFGFRVGFTVGCGSKPASQRHQIFVLWFMVEHHPLLHRLPNGQG